MLELLQCDYRNRGQPDKENKSQGRTKTIDFNIFTEIEPIKMSGTKQ